jgi:hypothetical protein
MPKNHSATCGGSSGSAPVSGREPGLLGGGRGDLGEPLVRHEGLRAAVGEDVGDFRPDQVPVDGHGVEPGLHRREVHREQVDAVGEHHDDRVARAQAHRLQAPSVPVGEGGQVAIAQRLPARVDDGGPVRGGGGDAPQSQCAHE